jgi:hypothetical protein
MTEICNLYNRTGVVLLLYDHSPEITVETMQGCWRMSATGKATREPSMDLSSQYLRSYIFDRLSAHGLSKQPASPSPVDDTSPSTLRMVDDAVVRAISVQADQPDVQFGQWTMSFVSTSQRGEICRLKNPESCALFDFIAASNGWMDVAYNGGASTVMYSAEVL